MPGSWLQRIEHLDPVTDHHEIYRLSIGFEFPWDYQRALEFALFRTYCVPSISGLLEATGKFATKPQQRYDDTALLMAELAENGYDSERGRAALRVINRGHGRYDIENADMLYVLSTFVFCPMEWIDRFGWRRLHENERQATYHYFHAVGRRMGIRDIPPDLAAFRSFMVEYERAHFQYCETNHKVGRYTLDLFCSWFPRPLRPLIAQAAISVLDDRMRTAFGFRAPPAWLGASVRSALLARSTLGGRFPARRTSKLARSSNRTYPNYPEGYSPEDIGAYDPPENIDRQWLRT